MENDKLKDFIDANKDAFEQKGPSDKVWENIEKDLGRKKPNYIGIIKNVLLIVFGILVIYMAGIFMGQQLERNTQQSSLQFANKLPVEMQEAEIYYSTLLLEKKEAFSQKAPISTVTEELDMLDSTYEDLKKDYFQYSGNDEELMIHLMIENYQLRIKLLEDAMSKMDTYQGKFDNKINKKQNEY